MSFKLNFKYKSTNTNYTNRKIRIEIQKIRIEIQKREKNSKTDRRKLPDRTQIEATFSSHNLEDWSSHAFTNIWPKNFGDGKWQKKTSLLNLTWNGKKRCLQNIFRKNEQLIFCAETFLEIWLIISWDNWLCNFLYLCNVLSLLLLDIVIYSKSWANLPKDILQQRFFVHILDVLTADTFSKREFFIAVYFIIIKEKFLNTVINIIRNLD